MKIEIDSNETAFINELADLVTSHSDHEAQLLQLYQIRERWKPESNPWNFYTLLIHAVQRRIEQSD